MNLVFILLAGDGVSTKFYVHSCALFLAVATLDATFLLALEPLSMHELLKHMLRLCSWSLLFRLLTSIMLAGDACERSSSSANLLIDGLLRSSNNRSNSNMVSISNSNSRLAPVRINAAQAHQYHRPNAIDRYVREVDQYNAWLGPQHHVNSTRPEAKARYLQNWDRDSERLARGDSYRGQASPDGAGTTNGGRGSHAEIDPCVGRGAYRGESSHSGGDLEVRASRHDGDSRQDGKISQSQSHAHHEASSRGRSNHHDGESSHYNGSR